MSNYTRLLPFKSAFERLANKGLLTEGDRKFLEELGILKNKKEGI